MKIPDIVKKTAYEQGFNDDIYFKGIIDGAELYSVGKLAEDGTPLLMECHLIFFSKTTP